MRRIVPSSTPSSASSIVPFLLGLAPCLVLFALFTALLAAPRAARSETVDTPPAGMRKAATHVVVGTVKAIYTRRHRDDGYVVTRHVAEVEVVRSEKGEAQAGDLIYVRYWRRKWVAGGTPPLSTAGHRGLPEEGETLRLYVVGEGYNGFGKTTDGGLDVYGANGFERLDDDAKVPKGPEGKKAK